MVQRAAARSKAAALQVEGALKDKAVQGRPGVGAVQPRPVGSQAPGVRVAIPGQAILRAAGRQAEHQAHLAADLAGVR